MFQACIVLVTLVYSAEGANILAMFLMPSYSHQMPLLCLSKALAARGHNLTVITANPSEVSFVYTIMCIKLLYFNVIIANCYNVNIDWCLIAPLPQCSKHNCLKNCLH